MLVLFHLWCALHFALPGMLMRLSCGAWAFKPVMIYNELPCGSVADTFSDIKGSATISWARTNKISRLDPPKANPSKILFGMLICFTTRDVLWAKIL